MERYLLTEIPVIISFEEAIKTLKIEEDDDVQLMRGLFEQAKEIVRPKILYKILYVDEIKEDLVMIAGTSFKSEVLANALQDVHRVFAYVATCGVEIDEWVRSEKDYIVSLWLDMIKEMFLGDALKFFHQHLSDKYGLEKVSFINPGSGDVTNWPIHEQQKLFPLLGTVTEDIGVILTDISLMIPNKSVSGFGFSSAQGFENCALCGRENCPGRRVPQTV